MIIDGASYHIEAPVTIKGQVLYTYTLGHELLFQQFNIDPNKNLESLVVALRVCSKSFADALKYIHNINTWGQSVKDVWLLRKIKKDEKGVRERWKKYLELHEVPEIDQFYLINDIDVLSEIRYILLSRCNHTPEKVWDVPFKLAVLDWAFATNNRFSTEKESIAKLEYAQQLLDKKGGKV